MQKLFKTAEQRLHNGSVHCQLAIVKRFVLKYGFKSHAPEARPNAECVPRGIKSLMHQRHESPRFGQCGFVFSALHFCITTELYYTILQLMINAIIFCGYVEMTLNDIDRN
ncbi:hypothetical protein CEXT_743971 [Caerostris extrusa]|uniref:DUF4817 domain-containing protein n=1 Tax=Caerostris extrusa TaxID=172846 RepID=A0AAV4QUW4_CAEEX|nr:hypothetical protein CEXT_743971 [Caerostris extrusa]